MRARGYAGPDSRSSEVVTRQEMTMTKSSGTTSTPSTALDGPTEREAAHWGSAMSLPDPESYAVVDAEGAIVDPSVALETHDLRRLYLMMRLTRGLDEESIALQRQGQLGVYASSRGQEACQVGPATALTRGLDWLMPAYRELGAAVAWGVDPADILHMWRGTWFSDYDVVELRYGMQTIPVATQLLHAAGYAMGMRLDGHGGAVLTYIGDGATSEGDFHEALNFAAAWKVPCVIVVQNNRYAISVPYEEQTAAHRIAFRGVGCGVPAVVVDGNDVLACRQVVATALARARSGGGPSLIEAQTFRMESHTTSDDASRYRTEEETRDWDQRDPLRRLRLLLERLGGWDGLEQEAEEAVAAARSELRRRIYDAPSLDASEIFRNVYVDPSGHFEDQMMQLAEELAASDSEPEA
jgi:2-oxoisovalerate dehydrogenase E1 component alpha subunit